MMELFYMLFPVSGVKTYIFILSLVTFILSYLTSMSGVSGAFLLLPFQMSILHFTGPGLLYEITGKAAAGKAKMSSLYEKFIHLEDHQQCSLE